MSKNIIIQEGGTAKQMTVSKIKVNNVGGGTSLWVPEDSVALATKSISQNGTYNASSENAYGYSQVTVNVAGGNGSATSSGIPTTSNGVDPGGIGSSVVGKDTGAISGTPGGDGNEYAIGIDSSGNIVATKVPSAIEIGKTPDKTSYTEGETIDYSGIIVILKGGDGAMLSNQDYPNGRVPFSELISPVTVAPSGASGEGIIDGYTPTGTGFAYNNYVHPPLYFVPLGGSGEIVLAGGNHLPNEGYDWCIEYTDADALLISAEGTSDASACFIGKASMTWGVKYSTYNPQDPTFNIQSNTAYNNGYKAVNVRNRTMGFSKKQFSVNNYELYTASGVYRMQDYLALYYGNSKGNIHSGVEIPVQWTSPYDGRTFEDTFEITVTASGSGYSDDSGGSSSGGGGGF